MRKKLLLFLCAICLPLSAVDWPQWLGPLRNGKTTEKALLQEWPDGGPPLIWEVQGLGEGFASSAIVGGRIYTQGQRGGRQYLMAFAVDSGEKIWETEYGGRYKDEYEKGDGPRGTPTVDGDRVYALSANGELICADTATGEESWSLDLFRTFGGEQITWGISESPLIDGDRVVVHASGSKAGLVALNKKSGEVIWLSELGPAGYASAVIAEVGGIRQYITLTGGDAIGVRADTGETLWRYSKISNKVANIATPVVHDGHVFVSTDYGTGCALLRLTASGGVEEVYFHKQMKNHYTTSVLLDGYLYGFNSRILTAMDFKTGEVSWRDRSVGKGQIIYGDGRLYLLSEDGVVGLVDPTPEGYQEISRFEMGREAHPTWALPVVANGRLYLRDQDKLRSYNIAATNKPQARGAEPRPAKQPRSDVLASRDL
jgi:outer membrane protein assembly factor BamB